MPHNVWIVIFFPTINWYIEYRYWKIWWMWLIVYYLYYSGSILYINGKTNKRFESNIDCIDPDLPSRRCSIEYFTVLSSVEGSNVSKRGSSGRSSITGQLNHFSPTYSDFIFSLKNILDDVGICSPAEGWWPNDPFRPS